MQIQRWWLAVGVATSLVLPADASAAAPPFGAMQQFQAEVRGTATITWKTQRGPVGETCQDWRYEEGKVTQTFTPKPKQPVSLLVQPGRISGLGLGRASLKGRLEKTFAFLTEPGCPAVCPDAKVAVSRTGPVARTADCAQTATRRKETLISCDSGSAVSGLVQFTGTSSLALKLRVAGTVQPGAEECQQKGDGLPEITNLFSQRKLRGLGMRGTLKKSRTVQGECPGTRTLPVPGLAQTKCTFRLRVTIKVHRLR